VQFLFTSSNPFSLFYLLLQLFFLSDPLLVIQIPIRFSSFSMSIVPIGLLCISFIRPNTSPCPLFFSCLLIKTCLLAPFIQSYNLTISLPLRVENLIELYDCLVMGHNISAWPASSSNCDIYLFNTHQPLLCFSHPP